MRLSAIGPALVAAALALAAPASSQTPQPQPQPQPPQPSTAAARPLETADVDAWLDGYMPYALKTGDVAGAVVVVVKDGKVLTERGYGFADVKRQSPVDPERTLFRPGSISKLFMWTAVLQLVEAGKLDLDADINRYLDFRIPDRFGKPVTLRNLMTHTAGFEEWSKSLFVSDQSRLTSLRDYVVHPPARIYPPGQVTAYSNYGAALAGYIVQRVSGETFEQYIQRHIFQPLGMAHATFVQPLPAAMVPDMALSYAAASQPPRPYELVNARPAGSLSATGADLARFMIAHLQDGRLGDARILEPETARLMHATAFVPVSPLPGMALGFYREDINGLRVIAHAGDTRLFHSELHLFLDKGVGLFVSMTGGKPAAAQLGEGLRSQLFRAFADRYFPVQPRALPTAATARRDGALIAGVYENSARSQTTFLQVATFLAQSTVEALPDGTVQVSSYKNPADAVKTWREVGPLLWQEVGGRSLMAARLENGRVFALRTDADPPVEVLTPVSPLLDARWTLPLLRASLAVLLAGAASWPLAAIVRRRYGQAFALSGGPAWLYRGVRLAAIVDLVLVVGWMQFFSAVGKNLGMLDTPSDPVVRSLQLIGVLAILGALVALWNLAVVWADRGRSWWARLSSLLFAIACTAVAWFVVALHLVTVSLDY